MEAEGVKSRARVTQQGWGLRGTEWTATSCPQARAPEPHGRPDWKMARPVLVVGHRPLAVSDELPDDGAGRWVAEGEACVSPESFPRSSQTVRDRENTREVVSPPPLLQRESSACSGVLFHFPRSFL